ncbi:MAG: thioredoxin family protein [Dysgonamonadaceae bacterium]|jgi:thiol:disulfide interchange protein DsbD|nr:thioredoxin family protein [Dysgonamonadaceae bacterium]
MKYVKLIALSLIISSTLNLNAQIETPVKWEYHINEADEIVFLAKVDNGWRLYDITTPEGGPLPTEFTFETVVGAELKGTITTKSKIESKYDNIFQTEVRWFAENPVFKQKLAVTDRENFLIEGVINYMTCNNEQCIPDKEEFRLVADNLPESTVNSDVSSGEDKSLKPSDLPSDLWRPVIAELSQFGENTPHTDKSWLYIFIAGFIGGLFALLTPCVWPVIPMTVGFFLKRSKSNRRKAIADAVMYGLSIIVIYLLLGLFITAIFGAGILNSLSTNAVFNLLFFALLLIFAISFFGAFELVLPSSWSGKIDSKAESMTGPASIFFMAFTLVLISFSCTGPIIGTLLVEAAGQGNIKGPAIGMLGFAIALALPFAFFALFPLWLKNLPKSGGWLNSVKIVLGFLELALALKFLSVADLSYGWGILDREVFLSLWIVIFTLLSLYLLGKIRFPHDSESKHVSIPRLFPAIISLSFAVYLIPGLWGAPLKAVSAFAPPLYTQDFNLYEGEVRPKFYDYEEGMEYARRNGKPVMIDFTGYGCVNCREMEVTVWSNSRVKSIIDNEYVLISLYVDDKTPLPDIIAVTESGKLRKLRTVGDRWSYLQRLKFGTNAQPFYVLLDNAGIPVAPSRAYSKDIDNYINYLLNGLAEYKNKK